jgi:hypothetical protein
VGYAAPKVLAEGEINVVKMPRGFTELVTGLRGIMSDNSTVPYQHVEQLDALLGELEGTQYAKFAKWLRIRSYLLDGSDKTGNNVLEGPEAQKEAALLATLSESLVADAESKERPDAEVKESPMLRDALAMKGVLLLIGKRKREAPEAYKEARKIYEDLVETYGYSRELRRLKIWAF